MAELIRSGEKKGFRVWLALLGSPVVLACAFLPLAAYLSAARGLRGDELAKAIEPLAVFPASVGFTAAFLLTRLLAKSDGLALKTLGWSRPTPVDVVIGLCTGGLLAAVNTWLLYPLVQASQPSFDPTLAAVSLPAVLLTMVIAAVAEDTLYRGYALVVLKDRHGAVVAIAVTTTFYALLTPAQGLPLVLWAGSFGVVLTGLRLWRRNLWPVTLTHCIVALSPKLLAQW